VRSQPGTESSYGEPAAAPGKTKARSPADAIAPLTRLTDLIPLPKFRKQQRKLLADQDAHVRDLERANRIPAARWNVFCTYLLWISYLGKRPALWLIAVVLKLASGRMP